MVPAPSTSSLSCPLPGGRGAIGHLVEDMLAGGADRWSPSVSLTGELIGLALNEVLHTVIDIAGPQTEADVSVIELWLQADFLIMAVRFRGTPLPRWLLANWDRTAEAEVVLPRAKADLGWSLVREVFDSVALDWAGSEQVLLLEKQV